MAASFSVNTLQVDFESVLAMEHSGMVGMFKTLENTGLKGFFTATGSVYEAAVGDFFTNTKVIAGTIVSSVTNRKLTLSKEVFAENFGLPTEGVVGFLYVPKETVNEMRSRFSDSEVPFRAPSKKKGRKMEYRLLHDIVTKALCEKAGSFDMVASEKFDLMVAISAGLKVNWAQILFNALLAMVNNPSRQSLGYAVQISILLGTLVKADLGESVKMHPQKVLTGKSVATYIKKNLKVTPAGNTHISFLEDSDYSNTRSQQMLISSPPISPHAGSKLEEVEKIVASLDYRVMSIYSRMLPMDSKVKSVDSRLGSMDSKLEQLLNLQSFVKHNIGHSRRAFYDKIDTVAGNVKSSQTALETTVLHHLTEHQLQLANDLGFVKMQLAEFVDHFKNAGDAKKGKGGQGCRPGEGSGGQGGRQDEGL
ncbi:dystroglycan-like [Dorcoceras hygrometricum]|uniref:Dystroglycan-like n=1 Tax=Dorcoceras hygrometricum TaxID=472368 RepID=A0A2Z7B5N1_9LAMI|nr:dystroglycan-like [Dorcoceras hygrometricum]